MTRKMKRVGVAKLEGIENAYVIASAHARDSKNPTAAPGNMDYSISFLYDAGNFAAEWEPRYGPIQVWEKATKGKPHYFYDFVVDTPFNFSQLAVMRERLPEAFASGDYEHIFDVLKRWASDR